MEMEREPRRNIGPIVGDTCRAEAQQEMMTTQTHQWIDVDVDESWNWAANSIPLALQSAPPKEPTWKRDENGGDWSESRRRGTSLAFERLTSIPPSLSQWKALSFPRRSQEKIPFDLIVDMECALFFTRSWWWRWRWWSRADCWAIAGALITSFSCALLFSRSCLHFRLSLNFVLSFFSFACVRLLQLLPTYGLISIYCYYTFWLCRMLLVVPFLHHLQFPKLKCHLCRFPSLASAWLSSSAALFPCQSIVGVFLFSGMIWALKFPCLNCFPIVLWWLGLVSSFVLECSAFLLWHTLFMSCTRLRWCSLQLQFQDICCFIAFNTMIRSSFYQSWQNKVSFLLVRSISLFAFNSVVKQFQSNSFFTIWELHYQVGHLSV